MSQPGCTAPAIPDAVSDVSERLQGTGLCHLAEMTGENLKSNGAETKDNTLMAILASPRL